MIDVSSCNLRYTDTDSAYLDCLNDNLAVLLDHLGVRDTRTPFACQWYFDFDPAAAAHGPILESLSVEELIREQTGCTLQKCEFERGHAVEQCSAFVERGQPVLVFGDAFLMPWLPYFGREHMDHSFIVDGISADHKLLHLVDAYTNRTEWGMAAPTETCLPALALEPITQDLDSPHCGSFWLMQQTAEAAPADVGALLRRNAEQMRVQARPGGPLTAFCRHYAQAITDAPAVKDFTLACWLVARARAYHQLWLSDVARAQPDLLDPGFVDLFKRDVAQPWQRVSEFAYILFRRVSQGRTPPETCFQMLAQTVRPQEEQAAILLAEQLATQGLKALEV
ncbi:MAG TPA: hypothetical protein VGD58_17700 [Herpetosiphonaceae bacterium]